MHVAVWICILLAPGLIASVARQGQPLPIQEALGAKTLAGRAPIDLSPDGKLVAFVVQDRSRQQPTGDPKYFYFSPTGVFVEAAGSDVWVSDTGTEQHRNLTQGKGTAWGASWSPDGSLLAFYSDRDGAARLWVWEKATDRIRRISDVIVRPFFNFEVPRWNPDGKSLLVKTLPAKLTLETAADLMVGSPQPPTGENRSGLTVRVFRAPADVPASQPKDGASRDVPVWSQRYRADLSLISVPDGRVRVVAPDQKPLGYWFSPRGDLIAYTSFAGSLRNTQQPLFDLVLLSTTTFEARVLVPDIPMEYGISVSWAPDGSELAYTTSGPQGDGRIHAVAIDGGTRRASPEADGKVRFSDSDRAPVWTADGRAVYALASGALWRHDFGSPPTEAVRIPGRSIRHFLAGPDGRLDVAHTRVVLFVSDAITKRSGIYTSKLDGNPAQAVSEGDLTIAFGAAASDVSASGTTAFVLEDASNPPDIWIADASFTRRHRATSMNEGIRRYTLGSARLVEWRSLDGTPLRGALLLPPGYDRTRTYPLIVSVYGGSQPSNSVNRFGVDGTSVNNMQLLATRGYAVLLPDIPVQRTTPVRDIVSAVVPALQRLVDAGIADPNRIGVMGHSYGGYSVLALITSTPWFKAAMASASMGDLFNHYGSMDADGSASGIGWTETGQGGMNATPWEARERYIENSPFFFLDRVQTPLLLVHGASDQAVPVRLADQTFVALRRLNKVVEYARYEGEEHWPGTWGNANAVDYWERLIAWFDRHLGNHKR